MSLHLFHHVTAFSLNEEEKKTLLEAGVEFTRTMKTLKGETVSFEIGEEDPRYQRVDAFLVSLGAERVRDTSMTVPTLRGYISRMVAGGGERFKQEAAVKAQWSRGREVFRESMELFKQGKKEEAREILDPAIAEAIEGNHSSWALTLCRHGAVLSRAMGDHQREIRYEEQALPFATNYRFAAYNLARLLLRYGQLADAEHYATEAYRQSVTQTTDDDRDLVVAILRQWPSIGQIA